MSSANSNGRGYGSVMRSMMSHAKSGSVWSVRGSRGDGEHTNQFLPVTRPLSVTGERESCSVLTQGGEASAWPPFWLIVDDRSREHNRILKPWGDWSRKDFAQRGRPAVPDHWTGRPGGSGAQPPLHLIYMVKVGRSRSS